MNTTSPGGFEDRLLSELKQVVAERPASSEVVELAPVPVRRFGWKPRLALGAAGVALGIGAAVALPVVTDGSGDSAYAVTPQNDGTIQVTINHLSNADGLEHKLRDAGIPAEVDYLPTGNTCKGDRYMSAEVQVGLQGGRDGSLAFTVDPADFTDKTLVIVTSGPPEGEPIEGEVEVAAATGAVQPCEPTAAHQGDSAVEDPHSGTEPVEPGTEAHN